MVDIRRKAKTVLSSSPEQGTFPKFTASTSLLFQHGARSTWPETKALLDFEILKSFPETVSESFDQFIGQHNNLSSRQLEFLNLLKGFIIDREKVEKKDLINAPFAVLHPQGIRGVFSPSEISEILQLTERLAG